MEVQHAESLMFWDWWRILGRTEGFDDFVALPTLRIDPSLFLAGQTVTQQQHVFMFEHAKDTQTQTQHKVNMRLANLMLSLCCICGWVFFAMCKLKTNVLA